MKNLLTCVFLFCLATFSLAGPYGTHVNINGITWTYQSATEGVKIVRDWNLNRLTGDIIIPSMLDGHIVTEIGYQAFYYSPDLTSVTIPSSVKIIGQDAFYHCTGLTTMEIPEGVTTIQLAAFADCTGLTLVTIPSSVTTIGGGAFENCTSLASVTIPSSVTTIEGLAFENCTGLTSITIPEGVTTIEGGAFKNCTSLASVTLPSSITSIGESVFEGCTSLTSVTLSEGLMVLGYRMFEGCTSLQTVVIPSSVTTIASAAFYECTGLTSVTIPSSVTTIASAAFYECTGLTSVTIPSSVTTIGDRAFLDVAPTTLTTPWIPSGMKKEQLTAVSISEGISALPVNAFSDCTGLTSVTIPSSVTTIGDYAFKNCTGLISITIPEGVTSIGGHAFQSCSNLVSITIPSTVTFIGDYALESCRGLESINFKGLPPTMNRDISSYHLRGYYLSQYADTWRSVLLGGIYWNNLIMAQATNTTYTITFDANGGEGGTSVTLDYGTILTAPIVTREGYQFTGWSPAVPATVPADNTTYTAQWKINQYKQTFDANGGEGGISVTLDYGTILTAPIVTREGYLFTGWSPAVPATVPADNTTYTAQWKINQYKQTFDANSGEGGTSVTLDYGTILTAPTVTRTGYTFTGWSPAVPATAPAKNVTYTAQWKINQYTAIFKLHDGAQDIVKTQDYGSVLTAPIVTREGYTFTGWSPEVPTTVPANNTTYTAQWEALPRYDVVVNVLGAGTVNGTGSYWGGATVSLVATANEGYLFCGWSTTPVEMEATYAFIMPEEAVTLTAYFAPKAAVESYVNGSALMSKEDAVQEALEDDTLYTADEIQEMAFDTPIVEVKEDVIEIAISLQTAETLNAWQAMALQGATLEIDSEKGQVRVKVPKGDKKAAFYKFVVPTKEEAQENE